MKFKIGDTVVLSPQDKQWNWENGKGVSLIGKVGVIKSDNIKGKSKLHGAFHGYTVQFESQYAAPNGDPSFVIEGRHLIKVDDGDDHDDLGCDEPYKVASWKDSLWKPREVKAK